MTRISLQSTGGVTLTISSSTRKAGPFTGNGVTTAFPFSFKVFSAADVLVVQALTSTGAETVQALTTNYTVALNADQNASPGGTVTMLVAPPTGYTLTLTSQVDNLQAVDVTNGGGFYPKVLNNAFDKATIQIQQLAEKVGRALKLPVSSTASADLPSPVGGTGIGWNATGTALVNFVLQTGTSLVNLAASGGAALIGFIQSGVGAVLRTLQDKLREIQATPYDYGAVGDGVTDDTAAVQALLTAKKNPVIAEGTFLCTADLFFLKDGGSITGTGTIKFSTSHGLRVVNTNKVKISGFTITCVAGYSGVAVQTGNEFNAIKTNSQVNYTDFVIDNITVDNFSSGYIGAEFGYHCVHVRSDTGSSIKRVRITNNTLLGAGYDPSWLTTLNGSDNIYCAAYNNSASQMEDVVIANNHCRYAGRQNISLAADINFAIRYVTITGNVLMDSTLAGVDLEMGEDVAITNNIFQNSGNYTGYWNPNSTGSPTSGMRAGISAHDSAFGRYSCVSNVFKNCYYGIAGYMINATDCTFYDSWITHGSYAGTVVILDDCRIYTSVGTKAMVTAYSNSTIPNRYTNCSFIDSATGARSVVPIYVNSGATGQNQFTNCFFSSAATTQQFIQMGYNNANFVNCEFNIPSMKAVKSYSSTVKFDMCKVKALTLVSGDYVGECTLRVTNSDLDLATIDDAAGGGTSNGATELTLLNNRIKVTATSNHSVSRKLHIVNNRFDVSSVAASNPIIHFYPQQTDGFGATILDVTNNEVVGTSSTKRFIDEQNSGAAKQCVVNFQHNRFGSTDVLTLANQIFTQPGPISVMPGTTAVTNNNYFNIAGVGFGLMGTNATLSTVVITGTAGQFSCASATLVVGQPMVISGAFGGTGSITGYASPTTYWIIAATSTTFTLSATQGGAAITTTAGTPTGLTYTVQV